MIMRWLADSGAPCSGRSLTATAQNIVRYFATGSAKVEALAADLRARDAIALVARAAGSLGAPHGRS